MVSLHSVVHTSDTAPYFVLNRKLTIDTNRHIILLIASREETLSKMLEENMLEILAWLTWSDRDIQNDFAFVMERYNKFLNTLSKTRELREVSMILGVTDENTLIFSTIGDIDIKLVERGGRITDIWEKVAGEKVEFSNISSGEIPLDSAVCISNVSLLSLMSRDDLDELSHMPEERFDAIAMNLLHRESHGTVHFLRVATEWLDFEESPAFLEKGTRHFDTAKTHIAHAMKSLRDHPVTHKITKHISGFQDTHPRQIQVGIFTLGIIFCIWLLWILFQNIFNATQMTSQDDKNNLIKVTNLVEKARTDMANKPIFNQDIKSAEAILAELSKNPQYIQPVEELTSKIVALKKEVNGIETANLTKKTSLIPIPTTGFTLIRWFSSEKTGFSYAVGREWIIGPYTNTANTPATVVPYPTGEVAKDADISADGVIYILMESWRIYTQANGKSDLISVTVTGQEWWENADILETFDSKLYLVKKSPLDISRHTSRLNNSFSPKSTLFASPEMSIADIAIDGAVYLLMTDGKITKVLTSPTITQQWIILNGIPGEYTPSAQAVLFIRPNLNFIYVMSEKNIWVFKPDSRNYKDLKSLTYVAQIEVNTPDSIISYFVPRDGNILITTQKWVFSVNFQISDGKILLDETAL